MDGTNMPDSTIRVMEACHMSESRRPEGQPVNIVEFDWCRQLVIALSFSIQHGA